MPETPPHAPLPRTLTAFRALLRATKSETQRKALLERIEDESRNRARIPRRLTETRLLEFARTPKTARLYGRHLVASHDLAWRLLIDMSSAAFAAKLRRLMNERDRWLAAEAGHALAWMGLDMDRQRIVRTLRNGSSLMQGGVARGLQLAAHHGRMSHQLRRSVFDEIAEWLRGHRPVPRSARAANALSEMFKALLTLDRRRGLSVVKAEGCLRTSNPAVVEIIRGLSIELEYEPHRFGPPVDPALIWPLFDQARAGGLRLLPAPFPSQNPLAARRRNCLARLLLLTADRDPLRTTREAKSLLREPPGYHRDELKQVLKRCARVPDPSAALQDFYRGGWTPPKHAARVLQAVEMREHILSDGLDGYMGNLGERWREARDGLKLVGADTAAAILESAAKALMQPVKTNGQALNASLKMHNAGDGRLKKLESQLWPKLDGVAAAIERYVAAHPGDFRRTRDVARVAPIDGGVPPRSALRS